jgi:hypothetical protein
MNEQKFKSVFRRLHMQRGPRYAEGWDAAVNGANEANSHFSLFDTAENTAEWERGNEAGRKFVAARETEVKP